MRGVIIGTSLIVVSSLIGWWLLIAQPASEQRDALDTEIAALQSQLGQLQNQRQQLDELRAQAPAIRQDLDRLARFIPVGADQATLLALLEGAGNAAGVSFTGLTFTDPTPVEGAPPTADPDVVLGRVTVTGTLEGTYFQLVDFLRRMEVGSSRAVLVTSVALTEGEEGFPALTASFAADIFALVRAPVVPVDPTDPSTLPTEPPTPAPTPTDADPAGSPAPAPAPTDVS